MDDRIPMAVVHYSRKHPDQYTGGVEAFARCLKLVFKEVFFMTRENQDIELVRKQGLPVICDNHKQLSSALLDWDFEPLACKPEEVPARMRRARAFLHLSRYEGNSIVCNEAMAMNLPCMFTRVGLMLDDPGCDVEVVSVEEMFAGGMPMIERASKFLGSLNTRSFQPRNWVIANASGQQSITRWSTVMDEFTH